MQRSTVIILSLFAALTSCSGAQSSNNSIPISSDSPTPASSPTPAAATSIAEAIDRLDTSAGSLRLNYDSTLLGIDTDQNGIRDDIDLFIVSTPATNTEKRALSQQAKALNALLTADLSNSIKIKILGESVGRAAFCQAEVLADDRFQIYRENIRAYTFNTITRIQAYDRFNEAASGMKFSTKPTNNCDSL